MRLHVIEPVSLSSQALGPRLLLPDHHDGIERACFALRVCCYADEPRSLVERYRELDQMVREHIAVEEELILPDYALHAPAGADLVRAQHRRILDQLLQVGIEVELHAVRAASIDALVERLRTHAAAEDHDMYPWAQAHLSLDRKRRVFVRMARSLRAMAQARAARARGTDA